MQFEMGHSTAANGNFTMEVAPYTRNKQTSSGSDNNLQDSSIE